MIECCETTCFFTTYQRVDGVLRSTIYMTADFVLIVLIALLYSYAASICTKNLTMYDQHLNKPVHRCGPQNISIPEGQRGVFIPCPGMCIAIWEINGIVYDVTRLRNVYLPKSGGLEITVVQRYMNNTSFRCYYPIEHKSKLLIQGSTIGYLTVTTALVPGEKSECLHAVRVIYFR